MCFNEFPQAIALIQSMKQKITSISEASPMFPALSYYIPPKVTSVLISKSIGYFTCFFFFIWMKLSGAYSLVSDVFCSASLLQDSFMLLSYSLSILITV